MRVVFVYNADRGVFNALSDLAHKILRPETYACNLCKLTYSPLGMRRSWKRFLDGLRDSRGIAFDFLHRDEITAETGVDSGELRLPAILLAKDGAERDGRFTVLVDAETLDACQSMQEIQSTLRRALDESGDSVIPIP